MSLQEGLQPLNLTKDGNRRSTQSSMLMSPGSYISSPKFAFEEANQSHNDLSIPDVKIHPPIVPIMLDAPDFLGGDSIATRMKDFSAFIKDPELLQHINSLEQTETNNNIVRTDLGDGVVVSVAKSRILTPRSNVFSSEGSGSEDEGTIINQEVAKTIEIVNQQHVEEKSRAKKQLQAKLDAKKKARIETKDGYL